MLYSADKSVWLYIKKNRGHINDTPSVFLYYDRFPGIVLLLVSVVLSLKRTKLWYA